MTQGANCPIRSFLPVTWLLSAYTDRRRHTRAIQRIAEQQAALPITQQVPPMPGTPPASEEDTGALLPVALVLLCGGLARGSYYNYNKVRARNGKIKKGRPKPLLTVKPQSFYTIFL